MLYSTMVSLCPAQTKVTSGPVGKMNLTNVYDPPPSRIVPAGEYEMGDHHDGMTHALPVHTVYVDEFAIDRFEVTNLEYCNYLNRTLKRDKIEVIGGVVYKKDDTEAYCDTQVNSSFSRITWDGEIFGVVEDKEDHPMTMVSWYGAVAYANWRSMMEKLPPCYDLSTWTCNFGVGGYRLPTEAEWEKAARGNEHDPYYRYPWANYIDGSKANYWNSGDPYENGDYPFTTPATYYNGNQIPAGIDCANGYDLHDMAGNVYEWCHDWCDHEYYSYSPYDNPKGPETGTCRMLRGGSWGVYIFILRCAYRYMLCPPTTRHDQIGFRLVMESP